MEALTALWILISISTKDDLGTELLKETYKGVRFWHRTHLVTLFFAKQFSVLSAEVFLQNL